ncbi:MAG: 50S ribosomal protein L17 [Clostridia bacterium]
MQRKLGKATDQRLALLQNQVSYFLWYGKLKTTFARAKEVQKLADKYITLAMGAYKDTVNVEKKKTVGSKESTVTVINDGEKKLAVRRTLMTALADIHEVRGEKETKKDYIIRAGDIKHPLIEKIFNEYAPRYAERAENVGQTGGYSSIYKLGARKGDAAEVSLIELI